jgi:NADPH-dependent curcumin reductase CurA
MAATTATKTRQVLLVSRPDDVPTESNFKLQEADVPALKEGELLVKSLFFSVDPYMRNRMGRPGTETSSNFELNKPFGGLVTGRVVDSKSSYFAVGDVVTSFMLWSEYNVISEKDAGLRKIPKNLKPEQSLNECGINGLTAYFGIIKVGEVKAGDNVLVSGAAGATGALVGQIAKLKGATRVVGVAGSDDKCTWVTKELGFDDAINYKKTNNIQKSFHDAFPKGIDVYFDNVGGETQDAVYPNMSKFGRIVCCGAISTYNKANPQGPRHDVDIIYKSLRVQGFIMGDYVKQYDEALQNLSQWVQEGKLKTNTTVVEGFENSVHVWRDLFEGKNVGKLLLKVANNE